MSRVTSGFGQSARVTPGRPLRLFFVADASATLAFCPLDGGSDEFVGVFGGLPARGFELSDARQERLVLLEERFVLLEELVDFRQQRQHQRL